MVDHDPYDIPLEKFDISQQALWAQDKKMDYFHGDLDRDDQFFGY